MGIRFRCPKGHKIHVKSFLAGKRGICPKCGVKVLIPEQTAPEFAERSAKRTVPRAVPAEPAGDESAGGDADIHAPEWPALGPEADRGTQAVVPTPATLSSDVDPIANAPHAKWFVRPPSGGQFGPASGTVFKHWLSEGRVTPDSYVWREGWAEWRPAQSVFGSLTASPTADAPSSLVPDIKPQAGQATVTDLYRRRKSSNMTITVVGLLGLACVVLFAALVYVVRFMK